MATPVSTTTDRSPEGLDADVVRLVSTNIPPAKEAAGSVNEPSMSPMVCGNPVATRSLDEKRPSPASRSRVSLLSFHSDIDELQHTDQEPPASIHSKTGDEEREAPPDPPRPYSAFSPGTKWVVAGLGGISAVFSPVSSNIFVPAIPTISKAFNRSLGDISLAVTVYLIFQAVTPSFFGAASDSFGRRPIWLLTMVIYLGGCIGLAVCPTSAFWLLLVLRAVQSIGGSAVISIVAGAVSDVAAPNERGKYMAVFQCGVMLGPAVGPFLGGVLAHGLGWRSIFWFLVIASVAVIVPFVFFFPETLRSIVGDGSIPPPAMNASPIQIYQMRKATEPVNVDRPPHKPFNPLSAFLILCVPEVLLIFLFVSFPYLVFYCILTVLSTALEEKYNLNELTIGLCYLPSGVGIILASIINGRQLDYWFRKEERRVGGDYRTKKEFRIEVTRIRCMYPFIATQCLAAIGLGWALQAHAHLAAVLVCMFFVGLGGGSINTATIYGQDILPGKGGAVSASLNLVRCAFGAVGTGIIQQLYAALGAGWTFVLLCGLCALALPLSLVVIKHGPGWRAKRNAEREVDRQNHRTGRMLPWRRHKE